MFKIKNNQTREKKRKVTVLIKIIEIPVERAQEFWDLHINYLVDDQIIEPEEYAYFSGTKYRSYLEKLMKREVNRHHMIYFEKDGEKIGACQFIIYQTEDGKCFILDYWIFQDFRNRGLGRECFRVLEEYTKQYGAEYFEINYSKEDNHRFWLSLGFVDNGFDEFNMPLMIKRP